MDVQDHVSGEEANGRVRVSGGMVDQPQVFVVCFVGALGLGCSSGTKGDEHGDVDGNHIVEESPNNLLEKVDGLWRKRGGVVEIFNVLDFGAIDGLCPGVGGILSALWVGMLELMQCFVDVAWHGDINSTVGVTPSEGEAAENISIPFDGDGVHAVECGDEMVCGGVAGVLDAEIFNNQREYNGQVGMCPERRRAGDGGIALLGKMQNEVVVGDDAGLIDIGHAFSGFEVDPAVQGKRKKVVLCNDLVRDGV